jgi:hypothetical protein
MLVLSDIVGYIKRIDEVGAVLWYCQGPWEGKC